MKSDADFRSKSRTHVVVFSGLLIAVSVVLKLIFEIYIPLGGFPSLRINLNSIPILLGGILIGPIPGFAIGVISDLLCYIIKPNGPWFFGFTLSSGLIGLIAGLLWNYVPKKILRSLRWVNVVFACASIAFLFGSGVLSYSDGRILYMEEPLNVFVFALFILLIALFCLYPFIAGFFLKKVDAEASEDLLVVISIEQIINSVFLNTLWLTILYGQAWMVLLPARVITNIFLIPMYAIIVQAVIRIIPKKYTHAFDLGVAKNK